MHGLRQAAGVDCPYLVFADQMGYPTAACRATVGVGWSRLLTDTPVALTDILGGHLSFGMYLRSILHTKTESVLCWDDPLPFLAEFLLLPYLLKKKIFTESLETSD